MDLLSTPTTFPLQIDWEGKMEPSSPSNFSQHSHAEEECIFDCDIYDYCNEGLYNNTLIDLEEDLKPNPSELLNGDVSTVSIAKLPQDLCYDDKLKLSPNSEPVILGDYDPLPTVVEDGFYEFNLQPEAKASIAGNTVPLMEFDCAPGNMELMNHLTPPQTPPQSTAFGGIIGCVLPMQQAPLQPIPMSMEHQQQLQTMYIPMTIAEQQQQLSFQDNTSGSDYYIVDEYAAMTHIGTNGGVQLQQQLPLKSGSSEPLQQVPGDIGTNPFSLSTEGYTVQQMNEMESIVRSLQMVEESLRARSSAKDCEPMQPLFGGFNEEDDESCGFSETGSIENGDTLLSSSSSSVVAHSPTYSDSAESSAYYSGRNDGDDEDWSPSKTKKLNLGQRNGGAVTKKRVAVSTRGRGVEEKKSRKKEQNKNAATRYRQKKKAEIEEILIVESKLRERNEELKFKSLDLGREIRCMKNLMRELYQSKGLI